jgi:hypothetical protein
MMRVNFRLVMVFVSIAIVVTRFVTGCKPAEPATTAPPAPAPAATTEQQPGTSAPQAPAVPDAAEPAGSQVQFK